MVIDPPIVRNHRRVGLAGFLMRREERAQDLVSQEPLEARPVRGIQVPPQEELVEGEEAQQDLGVERLPAGRARDRLADALEVFAR